MMGGLGIQFHNVAAGVAYHAAGNCCCCVLLLSVRAPPAAVAAVRDGLLLVLFVTGSCWFGRSCCSCCRCCRASVGLWQLSLRS